MPAPFETRDSTVLREAYETLDVRPGAPAEEIKAAYLDLVKVWHPDRHAHESDRLRRRAEDQLKRINQAYEALRPVAAARPSVPHMLSLLDFGGRFGYVDEAGAPVIYPQFVAAREFRENLAAAKLVEKWGYIDRTGEFAIAPLYDEADDFHGGLAAIKWHGRWGYVDREGRFAIQPRYQGAKAFDGDWAEVLLGNRWGRVHRSGEVSFVARDPGRQL
jgi:hypothetical protein